MHCHLIFCVRKCSIKFGLYLRQYVWPDEPQSQHVKYLSNWPSGLDFSARRQKLHKWGADDFKFVCSRGFLSDSIFKIWIGVNGGLNPNKLYIRTKFRSLGEILDSNELVNELVAAAAVDAACWLIVLEFWCFEGDSVKGLSVSVSLTGSVSFEAVNVNCWRFGWWCCCWSFCFCIECFNSFWWTYVEFSLYL